MPMRCFVHAVCDSNVLMDEAELAVLHRLGQVHLTNTAPMPRRVEPSQAEPSQLQRYSGTSAIFHRSYSC